MFSPGRAGSARIVAVLAALFAAALVSPGQAAANHHGLMLPTQMTAPPARVQLAAPVQWCGNDVATADRFPDAVGGNQVHVIYAYPADRPNRLPELASGIATDLAAIDEWWRRNDATRAPRYDTFPFPGCAPGFGQLDISAVRFPTAAASWDIPDTSELARTLYGVLLSSYGALYPGKKYLVYWDSPAPRIDACAFSVEAVNVFWYLLGPPMPGCPPVDVGQQTYAAMVAAHELTHNLGAVRGTAPHNCEGGHVCDDPRDMLYGRPTLRTLGESILDVGHDDYYAHSGAWSDVQDSPFHRRSDSQPQVVSVTVDPPVGGGVWTTEPGIQCPPHCSATWDAGVPANFRTEARAGYRFGGWSGACSGRFTRCQHTVAGATSVTATFTQSGSSGGSGGASPGVRNSTPRAQFARLAKYSYETRETVTLASASTDRDGSIASVQWDFGDGTQATGTSTTHVYAAPGRYRITLRVTDDRGAVDDAGRSVTVRTDPPRIHLFSGRTKPGDTARLRYSVFDRSALARVRFDVYVGRRVVMRRTIKVAAARSARGSVRWRVRATRKPLKWCAQASDIFGHSARLCEPIERR